LNVLSALYARVAAARRARHLRDPHRARLRHPVVSVGNLSVGGSGKTPVVAAIARVLLDQGERPAIVSRGYARRKAGDAVVVVSDGRQVRVSVDEAGDEPLMLARALSGVPVLVSAERAAAGARAEADFGATVTILDDGFQHVQLHRDVDLLLLSAADLRDQPLPIGRLREALDAAGVADAVVATGSAEDTERVIAAVREADSTRDAATRRPVFTLSAEFDTPRHVAPFGQMWSRVARARVVACAGIARPERFFASLAALDYEIVAHAAMPDHHWFRAADVARIEAMARTAGADAVVVTEKDAVRLSASDAPRVGVAAPWVYLPMTVQLEPASEFASWLAARLQAARQGRRS
jgi:tetraacyldisaccharide 4'-kinase